MSITPAQSSFHEDPTIGRVPFGDQLFVGPSIEDYDIDGMELSEAAHALGVSSDEVWRRIRNGVLLGRTVQGKMLVFTDLNSIANSKNDDAAEFMRVGAATRSTLPSLPAAAESFTDVSIYGSPPQSTFLHPIEDASSRGHQEILLLIDHLSLAKEENREILRLTQDAMSRLTQMTDAMLEMKDALISSKDEQMSILKLRLSEQSADLTRALKENENLETLTNTLLRQ